MARNIKIGAEFESRDAEAKIKKFGGSFDDSLLSITRGAQDLTSSFDIATQAIGGTVKAAMDMQKQGAAFNQTTQSFEGLTRKLSLAPDLLDQLRDASRGTITDMKLMSSTATLLAGASDTLGQSLGDATPRLLEIAKAANKLNPSLGDTAFLYESITTGIKRASPMILDNLGLTIKIGEANEKYAAALGKSVEQLTGEEQKVALLNATLEAGNVLMEQAGGNADSMTDSSARLETAAQNLSDAFMGKLAPALTNAADAAYLLLTRNEKIEAAVRKTNREILASATDYKSYKEAQIGVAQAAGYVVKEHDGLTQVFKQVSNNKWVLIDGMRILSEAEWENQDAAYADAGAHYGLAASLQNTADTAPGVADAIGGLNGKMETLRTVSGNIAGAYNDMYTAQKNLEDATKSFGEKMSGDVAGKLEEAGFKGQDLKTALEILDQKFGTSMLPAQLLKESVDELAKSYDPQKPEDFARKIEEMRGPMEDLYQPIVNARVQLETLESVLLRMSQTKYRIAVEMSGTLSPIGDGDGGGGGGGGGSTLPTTYVDPSQRLWDTNGDGIPGANGLDFIVPAGYPNDSYPIRVQSGEHVKVTPRDEVGKSSGGITINQLILPNVRNASDFVRELGQMSTLKAAAGGARTGRL